MFGIRKELVQSIKERYPVGCRVKLNSMMDAHAPVEGTEGTVMCVDDMGTVHVQWDNGSTLGVVYGDDSCSRI